MTSARARLRNNPPPPHGVCVYISSAFISSLYGAIIIDYRRAFGFCIFMICEELNAHAAHFRLISLSLYFLGERKRDKKTQNRKIKNKIMYGIRSNSTRFTIGRLSFSVCCPGPTFEIEKRERRRRRRRRKKT